MCFGQPGSIVVEVVVALFETVGANMGGVCRTLMFFATFL
jgi:hypothetical protein